MELKQQLLMMKNDFFFFLQRLILWSSDYQDGSTANILLFFFFLLCHRACRILVPQPGIKPMPSAVEAQSLNHWTIREVPIVSLLVRGFSLIF